MQSINAQRIEKASGEFTRRRLSLWFRGYYFNIKFIAHLSLIFMPYIAIHTAKTNSNLNTPKIYLSGVFKSLCIKFYSFCRTFYPTLQLQDEEFIFNIFSVIAEGNQNSVIRHICQVYTCTDAGFLIIGQILITYSTNQSAGVLSVNL